ncbi:MAG TPA: sulfonate ABC transporter substrate-binding protein [Leptolyngbyaceae cyanobacterium]
MRKRLNFRQWLMTKQQILFIFSLLFLLSLCFSLVLGCWSSERVNNSNNQLKIADITATKVVRIGHQPHGTMLYLKVRGNLEKRLSPLGISVEWTQFTAGPPILAAMGEGKIDIGYGGVVPPIFAQANGVPFVYVANDSPSPESVGILVREDSPIRTLADLKGKKITATKSSVAHYMLIQALIKAGLTLKDVSFIDLPPPEGQVAFKQGKVDAWIGWHPFLAELQESMPVRVLADGEGLTSNRNFYFATRDFANNHANTIKIIIEESQNVGTWVTEHPQESAKILTNSMKLNLTTAFTLTKNRLYEAQPIQDRAVEEQQRVAETFYRLGLLPKRIWVEDIVWKRALGKWGSFQ